MRFILFFLTGILILLNGGCTSSGEGALETQSVELAEAKFKLVIQAEANENLKQSEWLREAYLEFMLKASQVEVVRIDRAGDSEATVVTSVSTYSPSLRKTVLTIAAGIDSTRTRRFSFAEAMSLVAEKKGISMELVKQSVESYKFTKKSGQWKLTGP